MKTRRSHARGVMQHYAISDTTGLDDVIADMIRRYTPRAAHTTVLEGQTYVTFHLDAPTPYLTERAASSGWQVAIEQDDLPSLPQTDPPSPCRRRGRPMAWSLTGTFEHEPSAAALDVISAAADDDPRQRDFHLTATG